MHSQRPCRVGQACLILGASCGKHTADSLPQQAPRTAKLSPFQVRLEVAAACAALACAARLASLDCGQGITRPLIYSLVFHA